MARQGKDFERAVASFVQKLDPTAEVIFDHNVPDRDTGTPRQCDVWIEARFGGHIPMSILVSCKDHGRKLHIGDIGTFCDEVRSTGASMGIIYSRSGFTEEALKKAKVHGLACCRLYRGERADLPEMVWFNEFVCSQSISLAMLSDLKGSGVEFWTDVFGLTCRDGDAVVLDAIMEAFIKGGQASVGLHMQKPPTERASFPSDWRGDVRVDVIDIPVPVDIRIAGRWKKYRAKNSATLLNGSYCLTNESFSGTQTGPSVSLSDCHPGDAWEEMTDQDQTLPANRMIVILQDPNPETNKRILIDKIGPCKVVFPGDT